MPQANTPGREVDRSSDTTGPPVTESICTPASRLSSFSGSRPTDSSSVSQGMRRSVPGMGRRLPSTCASVTASSRSPSVDIHHGGGEVQGDIEVLQTLDDVPLQAAGIGHDLRHGVDTGALQRHAAGHDKSDIAATQDHHIPAGHEALHIHQTLGRTGGIDARRAGAGDVQRTTGGAPGSPWPE